MSNRNPRRIHQVTQATSLEEAVRTADAAESRQQQQQFYILIRYFYCCTKQHVPKSLRSNLPACDCHAVWRAAGVQTSPAGPQADETHCKNLKHSQKRHVPNYGPHGTATVYHTTRHAASYVYGSLSRRNANPSCYVRGAPTLSFVVLSLGPLLVAIPAGRKKRTRARGRILKQRHRLRCSGRPGGLSVVAPVV